MTNKEPDLWDWDRIVSQDIAMSVSKNQSSCELAGEAVILSLSSGLYYGLNPVGSRIWGLLRETATVSRIRDTLVSEFEVEPKRCESDLLILLKRLASERLIEVRTDQAP